MSSRLALVGISLAVATMIVVSGVMQGFEQALHSAMGQQENDVFVYTYANTDDQYILDTIHELSYVSAADPFVQCYGLIRFNKMFHPLLLNAFKSSGFLNEKKGVRLDQGHAYLYEQGQDVNIILPGKGVLPNRYLMQFEGIAGYRTHISNHIWQAEAPYELLLEEDNKRTGVHFQLTQLSRAQDLRAHLMALDIGGIHIVSWFDRFQPFLEAIAIQRRVLLLLLSLIAVVSSFSLLSGLMMLGSDKVKHIAMLRTMGMRRHQVVSMFSIQAAIVSLVGSILGYAIGYTVLCYASNIVQWIESWIDVSLINFEVYGVSELPVVIAHSTNLMICLYVFLFSVCVAMIPAWIITRHHPAEVLRHG